MNKTTGSSTKNVKVTKDTKVSKVTITLVRGLARVNPKHRKTAHSLGLKKIGKQVTFNKNDAINGMIKSISYLVKVAQ